MSGSDVTAKPPRLRSLDLLRGADMLLLAVVGPLMRGIHALCPMPDAVMAQFRHPWSGFVLWDIIMPLFIFMSGAAVPFALTKRLDNGRFTWGYWRHVLARVALLWFLGLCMQGNFLTLDPMKIIPYHNTLQSIAVGYLACALLLPVKRRWVRWAAPFVLTAAYGVMMAVQGDYTKAGNLAQVVDGAIYPLVTPAGSTAWHSGSTWFLTSMMFAAMALWGFQATELLKSALAPWKKAKWLAAYGVGMLAVGWGLESVVPCIKAFFSVSFTLQAMGWCMLALDAFYVLSDIGGFLKRAPLLTAFGQCALTAYLVSNGNLFRPAVWAFAEHVTQGVPKAYADGAVWFAFAATVVAIVLLRWKGKQK